MKILVVDDHPLIMEDIADELKEITPDATVIGVSNPLEVPALCDEHHFDVIFMDIDMPGENGLDLAKKILGIGPLRKYRDILQKNAGSEDYRNSSGVMRETFVKVVNEDVKDILPEIDVETLLVYGENDDATPLRQGKLIEKLMPDATLVVFENDDHYAYIHQPQRFCLVLDAFLRSEYAEK